MGLGEPSAGATICEPLDAAMVAKLTALVDQATAAFEAFDYARSLERTASLFWSFTDDYLELMTHRAYGGHGEAAADSAKLTLRLALDTLLRLFAPVLPYVTEEVRGWWREGSIHRAPWPTTAALREAASGGDPLALELAGRVLGEVRRAKTEAKRTLATDVARVRGFDAADRIAVITAVALDVCDAGKVQALEYEVGEPKVAVELVTEA